MLGDLRLRPRQPHGWRYVRYVWIACVVALWTWLPPRDPYEAIGLIVAPFFIAVFLAMFSMTVVFLLFAVAVAGQCAQFLIDLILEQDKRRALLKRFRR